MRAILIPAIAAVCLGAGWSALFKVAPGEQALVLRGDRIDRVVEDGRHLRIPLLETVVIHAVHWQRTHVFDAPFTIGPCAAQISLVYSIAEIRAFFAAGETFQSIATLRPDVTRAIADLPDIAALLGQDAEAEDRLRSGLSRALSQQVQDGLQITMVNVDLQSCDAVGPRILTLWEESQRPLPERGALSEPWRTEVPRVEITLPDGRGLRIDGAELSYDLTDETRFAQCFRDHDTLALRLARQTNLAMTEALQDRGIGALAALTPADIVTKGLADCGVGEVAMHLENATLFEGRQVNCSATPEEEACQAGLLVPPPLGLETR